MFETTSKNVMGSDGFYWFTGVVEDNKNDPEQLGRVRVRVMGDHTQNKSNDRIPTENLPWALIMNSATEASIDGIGQAPVGIEQGSWVVGFYLDGQSKQIPMIMGTFGGIPEDQVDPSIGFNDPDAVYPMDTRLKEPDTNRLTRGEKGKHGKQSKIVEWRRTHFMEMIPTCYGMWSEPLTEYNAEYPYNKVQEHHFTDEENWGHTEEWDSTPGKERYKRWHKNKNFIEVYPDGKEVRKVQGTSYEIDLDKKHIYVEGDYTITVNGNMETFVLGLFSVFAQSMMFGTVDPYLKPELTAQSEWNKLDNPPMPAIPNSSKASTTTPTPANIGNQATSAKGDTGNFANSMADASGNVQNIANSVDPKSVAGTSLASMPAELNKIASNLKSTTDDLSTRMNKELSALDGLPQVTAKASEEFEKQTGIPVNDALKAVEAVRTGNVGELTKIGANIAKGYAEGYISPYKDAIGTATDVVTGKTSIKDAVITTATGYVKSQVGDYGGIVDSVASVAKGDIAPKDLAIKVATEYTAGVVKPYTDSLNQISSNIESIKNDAISNISNTIPTQLNGVASKITDEIKPYYNNLPESVRQISSPFTSALDTELNQVASQINQEASKIMKDSTSFTGQLNFPTVEATDIAKSVHDSTQPVPAPASDPTPEPYKPDFIINDHFACHGGDQYDMPYDVESYAMEGGDVTGYDTQQDFRGDGKFVKGQAGNPCSAEVVQCREREGREVHVMNNRRIIIAKDDILCVHRDKYTKVKRDSTLHVLDNRFKKVETFESAIVEGNKHERIEGNHKVKIRNDIIHSADNVTIQAKDIVRLQGEQILNNSCSDVFCHKDFVIEMVADPLPPAYKCEIDSRCSESEKAEDRCTCNCENYVKDTINYDPEKLCTCGCLSYIPDETVSIIANEIEKHCCSCSNFKTLNIVPNCCECCHGNDTKVPSGSVVVGGEDGGGTGGGSDCNPAYQMEIVNDIGDDFCKCVNESIVDIIQKHPMFMYKCCEEICTIDNDEDAKCPADIVYPVCVADSKRAKKDGNSCEDSIIDSINNVTYKSKSCGEL